MAELYKSAAVNVYRHIIKHEGVLGACSVTHPDCVLHLMSGIWTCRRNQVA